MIKGSHKSQLSLLSKRKTPSLFVLPKAMVIYAKLNGNPEIATRITGQTFDELLSNCTQVLKLTSAARKFYLEDGRLVQSYDQIKDKMELYVSQGEPFIDTRKLLRESITLKEMSFWGLNGLYLPKSKSKNLKSNREIQNTNKIRRVLTFRNGDYLMSSSFEVVSDLRNIDEFKELCGAKQNFNGQYKKVFSSNCMEVTDLSKLLDEDSYVWNPNSDIIVLGPVWASLKDDIDRSAVYQYFRHIHGSIKKLLKKERKLLNELNAMTNEDIDNVHSSSVKAYSKPELKVRIKDSEEKVEKLENDLLKFEGRLESNSADVSKEIKPLSNSRRSNNFKTIAGLRFLVYTNGHPPGEKIPFYFNVEQSKKGVSDESILFNRLLDELSKNVHLTKANDHSKGCLVRRLFTDDGTEIKAMPGLSYDQILCVSYGEDWINPNYLCLSKKVHFMDENLEEQFGDLEDIKEYKICKKMTEKQLIYNLPVLQHKTKSRNYLMISLSISERSSKSLNIETWSFSKTGRIFTKQFPSLSLTLFHDGTTSVRLADISSKYKEKLTDRDITCYTVQLYPQESGNCYQLWEFTPSGFFCNKGDTGLLLTYLPIKITQSQESFFDIVMNANICASKILPNFLVSNQRWGFKHLDQWKLCDLPNVEWHKAALIWPLKKDGSLNNDLTWPLEGNLLVGAPSSSNSQVFLDSRFPIKLNVLKNNDHRSNKAIIVTGPDLTKLVRIHRQDKYVTHCSNESLLRQEFEMFLVNCTGALGLPSVTRRLFNKDGKELFSLEGLENYDYVYASMGEMWCSPEKKLSNIQLRSYTNKLTADVERLKNFINFSQPSPDLVMGIRNDVLDDNSQLEIQLINEHSRRKLKMINDEDDHIHIPESVKERLEDESLKYRSVHEKTCEAAKMKYGKNSDIIPALDLSTTFVIKEKEKSLKKLHFCNLQEFIYEKNYILASFNQRFGLYAEEIGKSVIFKKIISSNQHLQYKWILHKSGLIESMYYRGYVLTISCPKMLPFQDHSSAGYIHSLVSLEKAINTKYGNATQRFNLNKITGFIYPLFTNDLDKGITSTLLSSICTRFVSPKEINQQGYMIDFGKPENNIEKSQSICLSCVSILNGRFPITPINDNKMSFLCSYSGGFKVIKNPNLTLEEAEETYKFYNKKLSNIKEQLAVKPCFNRIAFKAEKAIRVLLYRNGFGRVNPPFKVTGKSISQIMEVATKLFNLQRPVRILYTETGKPIQDELSFLNVICNSVTSNFLQDSTFSVINNNVTEDKKISEDVEKAVQINLSVDGKYFIIESEEGCSTSLYSFEIFISNINGLKQFSDNDGAPNLYFLINYDIFNNQINTDLFHDESNFESEITEFTLKSSEDDLRCLFLKDLRVLRVQLISATVDNPESTQDDIKVDIKSINAFADINLNWISENISNINKECLTKTLICPLISTETFKQTSATLTMEVTLKLSEEHSSVTSESNITEPSYSNNTTAIELWASLGEVFSPHIKEKTNKSKNTKMEQLKLQSYNKKYLLRNLKGERIKKLNCGTLEATGDSKNPVKIKDNWMFPSRQELDLLDQINVLEAKLSESKSQSATSPKVSGSLYSQKHLKNCLVYLNGDKECHAVSVWGETIYDIMHNAARSLQMKKTPKCLFNRDGIEIRNIEEISTEMILALSSHSKFISSEWSLLQCEIKANWGRARAKHGETSTELEVQYRPITVIDVDPFEPPEIMKRKEQMFKEYKTFKVFENGQPCSTASIIRGNNFSNVLVKAAEVLGLTSAMKCFYTTEGKRITNFKEILNDDILAASVTGRGFVKNEES